MSICQLRAEDPSTGTVVGWRYHSQLTPHRQRATWYYSPSSISKGLESAKKRWPMYAWRAFPMNSNIPVDVKTGPRQNFSRQEVLALLAQACETCASLCEAAPPEWEPHDYAAAIRRRSDWPGKALP